MEPERRIEKWLHAFAKKRREQAGEPMSLRPAMRERLQREIARQSDQKNRGGFFSALFFGPRLKLTFAACFAALAVGGWVLLRESTAPPPAQLSMNKTSEVEIPPATVAPIAPAPAPPLVTSPAVASADKKVFTEKQKTAPAAPQPSAPAVVSANRSLAIPPSGTPNERDRSFQQRQLTVATAATSAPATNPVLAFKKEIAADSFAAAGAVAKDTEGVLPTAAASPTSNLIAGTINGNANAQTRSAAGALQQPAAAPSSTTALFDAAKTTGAVTVSQTFNRQEASTTRRTETTELKSPVKVLTSFRVEQNGNHLKIVDADGSIYTGSVQIAQQEPAADYAMALAKNAPKGASQLTKAPAPAPRNYFFRVAGTNRNLNENVVFSGNFIPFTNHQTTAGVRGSGSFAGSGGGGAGGSDQAASQPVQAVLSNSEINGNVAIGDQKAVNLIATPAH